MKGIVAAAASSPRPWSSCRDVHRASASVVIGATPNSEIELGSDRTLFTADNWNTPQLLALLADDDRQVEGDEVVPVGYFVVDDESDVVDASDGVDELSVERAWQNLVKTKKQNRRALA